MRKSSLKTFVIALCAILLATPLIASSSYLTDGNNQVTIKASSVQGVPRTNSILAYINGHSLTVTFTENLGTVQVEVTTATATVAYTLPSRATHATLELANTLGVKVLGTELNGNNGTVTLDLGRLAGGVYCYTVRCGELVETGKLVVVK